MTDIHEVSAAGSALSFDEKSEVEAICTRYNSDGRRMMDILIDVQKHLRCIPAPALELIAEATGLSRVAVEGVASFYAFLSQEPKGRIVIRLCDDIVDRFAGMPDVARAFEEELSLKPGEGPPHIRLDRAADFLVGDRL